MKLFDVRNDYDKRKMFYVYQTIVPYGDDYEVITKREMIQDIIEYYNELMSIEELYLLFDEDELLILKEALSGVIHLNDENENLVKYLVDKLFLVKESEARYVIPEELYLITNEIMRSEIPNVWKELQDVNQLIRGISCAYGILTKKELIEIIHKVDEGITDYLIEKSLDSSYTKFYCGVEYIPEADEEVLKAFYDSQMIMYIIKNRQLLSNPIKILDKKTYLTIAKYNFDATDKYHHLLSELGKYYSKDSKESSELIKELVENVIKFKSDKGYLLYISMLKINDEEKLYLSNLCEEVYETMSSPSLSGHSVRSFEAVTKEIENSYVPNKRTVEYRLDEEDYKVYTKVMYALFGFYNKRFQVVRGLTNIEKRSFIPPALEVELQEMMLHQLDAIDEFINSNPSRLSKEELNIAEDFKRTIEKEFIVAKHENGYSYLVDDDMNVYLVKGSNVSIKDHYPNINIKIRIILFPFKNTIVTSDWREPMRLEMTNKLKKELKHALRNEDAYIKVL